MVDIFVAGYNQSLLNTCLDDPIFLRFILKKQKSYYFKCSLIISALNIPPVASFTSTKMTALNHTITQASFIPTKITALNYTITHVMSYLFKEHLF